MANIHPMRRKEKEITDPDEMKAILVEVKYVTIAMCQNNEPYLVNLSAGFDQKKNAIYFHCASAGKKVEILAANNLVWGQAIIDRGYVEGQCDHLFSSVQFRGRVSFVENVVEKWHGLKTMIQQLENEPEKVLEAQVTDSSLAKVTIGRIDIDFMSGKKSQTATPSL